MVMVRMGHVCASSLSRAHSFCGNLGTPVIWAYYTGTLLPRLFAIRRENSIWRTFVLSNFCPLELSLHRSFRSLELSFFGTFVPNELLFPVTFTPLELFSFQNATYLELLHLYARIAM